MNSDDIRHQTFAYQSAPIPSPEQRRRGEPGAKALPNPHKPVVAALAATMPLVKGARTGRSSDARTLIVHRDTVSFHLHLLRTAGDAQRPQVTVRCRVDHHDDETTTITFWTATRIHRTRPTKNP